MPVTIENVGPPLTPASIGEWVKAATIRVAEAALIEEVGKGFDNQPIVITDGVPARDYSQVKPFGKIEFAARPNMADAVAWALNELQKLSPFKTGRYVSSHTVMINGTEVTGDITAALKAVKETDRVQIVNPQPYAKKIEGRAGSRKRGLGAVKGLSPQAPGGVYRVVERELIARYGRTMFFDFKYVKLDSGLKVRGYIGGGNVKVKGKWHSRGPRKRVVRDATYPEIQFFIKPTGLAN